MRPDLGLVFRAAPALTLALLAALGWWWAHPPVVATDLLAHGRGLSVLERMPAPGLGPRLERWRMIAAGGDTVTGLWRPAARQADQSAAPARRPLRAGPSPVWSIVILGGIGTDDRAALLVPDSLPIGVLAVSWPWKGPRQMGTFEFLASLPAIRTALLRTPGAIARGVAAVRQVCPGSRVALIGASLGVPPTVAALALTRPDAVILVDGAADFDRLLCSEISLAVNGGPAAAALAMPAAAFGARLLSSLEPARYGAASRGIPMLFVDAERNERYPRACIARLHQTFPHAARATHPGPHVRTEHRRDLEAIVDTAWRWLATLPARGAPSP